MKVLRGKTVSFSVVVGVVAGWLLLSRSACSEIPVVRPRALHCEYAWSRPGHSPASQSREVREGGCDQSVLQSNTNYQTDWGEGRVNQVINMI